jgi:hypothetical protein
MIRAILGHALEGLALYVLMGFLAYVMAIPHAVAHWGFLGLVCIACFPGLMARSPAKAGRSSQAA